ncbi:MAG TPA: CaiB/BaiF CoA-transferase family protein [Xanthobacteraceae bacterium]|nr:CaiB/BaiF CoA-transferase family protein [Xanthobacteraceae bacterium]
MAGPLSHVRVLDLSRIMAGPWAGQILADLGADVVKVERPGAGDDTRGWGPPFLKDRSGTETREAGYYLSVNRGKRSITLELDKPEGQRVVRALAARSDIVLENFKVGTLARFGLGYEQLKAVNPKLIYCSITGFGQSGPRRDAAAYDFMIQAMCGLMSVTGEPDEKPGGCPEKVGVPIVDIMSGMYAAIAVLAALARRNETGRGDYIDIGMLDVGVACLANQAMNYLVSGKVSRRTGNAHPNIQPQDVFASRDGHMVLVVGNDGQFAKCCEVLGRPDWATDERFAKNAGRVRNLAVLRPLIAEILLTRDTADWIARLEAAGVPCGPINTVPQVFEEDQVRHRGMLTDIAHPLAGTVPQVVSPMRFADAPLKFERAPPLLGEHTAEILRELGIEDARR